MFVANINALGVSGTYQEVKTKTVVLQTHNIVTINVVVTNPYININAVNQLNFEVPLADKPPTNLNLATLYTVTNLNSLDNHYFIDAPLASGLNNLEGLLLTATYTDKSKEVRRCLLLFSIKS